MTTFAATTNGDAFSTLRSQAAASGIVLGVLSDAAAVALTVANILGGGASSEALPAGNVTSGTFGSVTSDTGIYSFPSQVGVGGAGNATTALRVAGSITAAAANAVGISASSITLIAAANNDALRAAVIGATFTPGAFTGLAPKNLDLSAFSTAAFTSPGDPISLNIGIVTGTGATNAFGIRIAPPAGATNNYLLSHTTPATFSVSDSGVLTAAGQSYLGRTALKVSTQGMTVSSLGTAQNSTPTAAQLQGGVVTQTGQTGAGTVTVPIGSALDAAVTGVATGDTFECIFANLGGGFTLTLTGGGGTTILGTAAVPSGKFAQMLFVRTNTNTWSVYCVVSA